MKRLFLIIALLVSAISSAQESNWERSGHDLSLNYNLLGRHTAQGLFYGAAGYGTGMWLSGNRTEWGIVGSVLAANIPILLEKKLDEPETVIGRNLGAISVGLSFTFAIEMHRNGKWDIDLPYYLEKH